MSLNDTFVLDLKYSLPEETNKMDRVDGLGDSEIKRCAVKILTILDGAYPIKVERDILTSYCALVL